MNDSTIFSTRPRWQAGLMADAMKYAAYKEWSDGTTDSRYEFDTYEYAAMFCRYARQIEEAVAPRFPIGLMGGSMRIHTPASSNYQCRWADITYTPTANNLPRWFYRKMTEVFFGCKWSKKQ